MDIARHDPSRPNKNRWANAWQVARVGLAALIFWACGPVQAATDAAGRGTLTVDECVEIALQRSADIKKAEAKVQRFAGVLAEVESIFYPKLFGLGFVAPMYTIRGNINDFEARWRQPRYWGPYAHFEAVLAQPLYTFGRAEAGAEAAAQRLRVAKARVREAKNLVAREVRRLYYSHLYARSLVPSLQFAVKTVNGALEKANEMFAAATGEVTQTDLNKLKFGRSQARSFLREARDGAALALAALKHTMGLPETAAVELADSRLSRLPDDDYALANLLVEASRRRPEWAQVEHGSKAAIALEEAQKLANMPILFVGGQIAANWAPTTQNTVNPYHRDRYNDVFGGVAVGLQFSLDPARAHAKAEQARALQAEMEALRQFAQTGIPLQVRKAYQELERARDLVEYAKTGEKAARKWMTFAATNYGSGLGEAKELLEGLLAYVNSKRSRYDNLRNYYLARAELYYAIGRTYDNAADAPDTAAGAKQVLHPAEIDQK